jgi:replicative DNA helicase
MDISAVVLNKLLSSKDLEAFSRIKLSFLDPAYSSVYIAISRYYEKYSTLPSFEDLEVSLREGSTKNTIEAIKLTEAADVDLCVAVDALIDQYTQNEALRLIDKFVDKVTLLDTEEIKDSISNMVLTLDEKTMSTEGVSLMDNFFFFLEEEEISRNRIMLGINNDFDAAVGGIARQEYFMIGGERGSGKSLVCANIQASQYEDGNVCPYFSIEMTGRETLERTMAILANVDYQDIKLNRLTPEQLLKVVQTRADMFLDAQDLVEDFKIHRDKFKFESAIVRNKLLKPDNQIIVVDDRNLTISKIDIWLGKLKAKFGDKLTSCVVDYLNQINIPGNHNKYDWQPQVEVSTQLKNLARKYDLVMFTPYQIDANGEARFAKGILDAADFAVIMKKTAKEDKCLSMQTTKIRGASEQEFHSGMNWSTLRVDPNSVEPPKKETKKSKSKDKEEKVAVDDSQGDVPWKD